MIFRTIVNITFDSSHFKSSLRICIYVNAQSRVASQHDNMSQGGLLNPLFEISLSYHAVFLCEDKMTFVYNSAMIPAYCTEWVAAGYEINFDHSGIMRRPSSYQTITKIVEWSFVYCKSFCAENNSLITHKGRCSLCSRKS